ncbi:RHS repeat-associated core domain-containing protein [Pseudomonas putida]|uniref:RHS repeat-associated core domain-containing protein n=1 Tax=Pseudomonas putida TaxID=303 RepID=A0A4D6X4K5_PSEPU|nr:RHS repeat-associated core domain-containing protein [Pseudomonas putida]QCI10929.1 RHS repeat-associated core domain-containing protein [Pseudomonas putida]
MTGRPLNLVLGRQRFDGLGRQLRVESGGRATQHLYRPGQLQATANLLADGQRIAFSYEPALDNAITRIQPEGEADHQFTYDPNLGLIASTSGPLGTQTITYSPSGKPIHDSWAIDGTTHTTYWRYSLTGRSLGFIDAEGADHQRLYDDFGRLQQCATGSVLTRIHYDEFSRPTCYLTHDTHNGNRLEQRLVYDHLGREHMRTCHVTLACGTERTVKQSLVFTDLDQVARRVWDDGARNGVETFGYDVCGRLHTYTASPEIAPLDPFGNRVIEQVFTFNRLDGYEQVISTYADGSSDTATFHYDNPADPSQPTRIEHSHTSWPCEITLQYDACGRLVGDSLGRRMRWDAQGRLSKVDYQGATCQYGYSPSGELSDRIVDGVLTRSFHSAGQLTHERCGDDVVRIVTDAGQLFALGRLSAGVRQGNTTLLGCDAQGSVLVEADEALRLRQYTAHGAEPDQPHALSTPYGYTGERREPLTGWYIPAGYRPYDPLLMMFLAPDSESPFGRGGINAYAYCGGDPVNRVDPDGHSWWKWLVAGIGLVLGAVATVASFGAAAPAFAAVAAGGIGALTASGAASITAATLGAVSLGTGIASTIMEAVDKDSKAASVLGWISLGTGLAGSAVEIGPRLAHASHKASRLVGRTARKAGGSSGKSAGPSAGRQPAQRIGDSSVLFEAKPGNHDVVFHENFLGTGTAAFETHGHPFSSKLMNGQGRYRSALKVALNDIEPQLRQVNYPQGKELILLACEGGSSGAAQKVATALQRPVRGYAQPIYTTHPQFSQSLRVTNHARHSNLPTESIGFWERLKGAKGPFVDRSDRRFATSSLYFP